VIVRSCRLRLFAVALSIALGAALVGPSRSAAASAPPAPHADALAALRTFSFTGKQRYILAPGKEVELFHHLGRGCLTYMWFAMDERTRIRIYVDGESRPSIDMELDLGHGYAFGGPPEPFGNTRMGRYGGQFNTFRIPYGSSVRVCVYTPDIKLDSPTGGAAWWTIRATDNLPLTVGGIALPANARLKLYRLEPYEAKPLEEFPLCDVSGSGMLFLVVMAARGERKPTGNWTDLSFMEGQMRAYIDGSKQAQELSSGLEDYFLGSGYFHQNETYFGEVAGLTYLNKDKLEFSAYRFHDQDPVIFHNGFRMTCRDGEAFGSYVVGDPSPATYWTYVWLYQW
jgi:hypothetical protein